MRFNRHIIKEGKLITIKRKYTDAHPERLVQVITPIRNKILSYIDEHKTVTRTQFANFLKGLNEETGRNTSMKWVRHNANLFKRTNENGIISYSLSKLGRTVLSKTMLNENTDFFYSIKEGNLVSLKMKVDGVPYNRRFALVTPVRQKVLAYVGEKEKISKEELAIYLKSFNEESGRNTTMRWFKQNAHLFKVTNEKGITYFKLSKIGAKVLDKTRVNECVFIDEVINEDYSDNLIQSIGKRCGIDLSQFNMNQIKIGMAVELKHGSKSGNFANITDDDPEMTLRIVLGNLMINSKYYTEAKPEDWGNLETTVEVSPITTQVYQSTTAGQNTTDVPSQLAPLSIDPEDDEDEEEDDFDDFFEPEEFEEDDEEPIDDLEDDEDEDDNDDNDSDNDDNDDNDSDNDDDKSKNELTNENKEKIVSFLNDYLEGKISSDDLSTKMTSLADELNKKSNDLEKLIYEYAYKASDRSDVSITIDGLEEESISKIKDFLQSNKGKVVNDSIIKLAEELKVETNLVKKCIFNLAMTEFKRKKMTNDNASFESTQVSINNTPGMGRIPLGKRVITSGSDINGGDGKTGGDVPDSLFVGTGQNRGRYSTRKMFSLNDFMHHNLQETLNNMCEAKEPSIGKKFDKIVSTYKELLARKDKMMKDFVVAFKAETDPIKKEKMKSEHIANYTKLNSEISDMERKYNAAIQNLDVADLEDE